MTPARFTMPTRLRIFRAGGLPQFSAGASGGQRVPEQGKAFFDEKIAMLLTLVDETKSVRAAGQRMQLIYSSCWNMIRTLESQLGCTLIERIQGGAGGIQSRLTERGQLLLSRFAEYERRIRADAEALYPEYFGGLFE